MISVAARSTRSSTTDLARVTGVVIPNWNDVTGLQLLQYVDYHRDAVFNDLQLNLLQDDLAKWLAYETESGDAEGRVDKIESVIELVLVAMEGTNYVIFLGE